MIDPICRQFAAEKATASVFCLSRLYNEQMQNTAAIIEYLGRAGFERDAARVYHTLLHHRRPSILKIAKTLGISRSRIYQHIALLQERGLVSAEQLSYGTLYRALPLENIERFIAERETEVKVLRGQFDAMSLAVQSLMSEQETAPTIKHYYGQSGLKQASWNLSKAAGEYRAFITAHLGQHFDKAFANRWNQRILEAGITTYDLTNAEYAINSLVTPFDIRQTYFCRIDPAIFTIEFEVYIYNNMITLLDFKPDSLHAVEIQNPPLFIMMRQIFDVMWNLGTPISVDMTTP